MRYLLVYFLLILTSCASSKSTYSYFLDCEKNFSEFLDLSSCALKDIQKDCQDKLNCINLDNRFVDIIKRLKVMVDRKEISDNEAMFRYFNLMDFEESKFKTTKNNDFKNYNYYINDLLMREVYSCNFLRTGFCF